jgi:hypothetical protein
LRVTSRVSLSLSSGKSKGFFVTMVVVRLEVYVGVGKSEEKNGGLLIFGMKKCHSRVCRA